MKFHIDLHVHPSNVDELKSIKRMLNALLTLGGETMTHITDAVAMQRAAFDRLDVSFAGISADIIALIEQIEGLHVTPEDQAALDEVVTRAEALAAQFEGLDAQNPSVVLPVEPPV